MKTTHQQRQAIFGAILGQAIGDAIGHPIEFGARYGKHAPGITPRDNRFTDDTQMMVAIAEALLNVPPHKHGMDLFMAELSLQFVEFKRNPFGGGHRAPGGACMSGCGALGMGTPWQHSGGKSSKGNGSAMRSSVVGAMYFNNLDLAWQVGCMTSIPTHNNLEAILGAGAVAVLVACGIQGIPFNLAIAEVLRRIEKWEQTVPMYPTSVSIGSGYSDQNPWYSATHIAQAYTMGKGPNDYRFSTVNGDDFAVIPAVSAAVYYNTRYSNYRDIVTKCAENTGDSDTTGAIAGAIAGARLGYGFIPFEWRKGVEQSEYFHKLAERVWAVAQTITDKTTVDLASKEPVVIESSAIVQADTQTEEPRTT